jgi:hypothetical protein
MVNEDADEEEHVAVVSDLRGYTTALRKGQALPRAC